MPKRAKHNFIFIVVLIIFVFCAFFYFFNRKYIIENARNMQSPEDYCRGAGEDSGPDEYDKNGEKIILTADQIAARRKKSFDRCVNRMTIESKKIQYVKDKIFKLDLGTLEVIYNYLFTDCKLLRKDDTVISAEIKNMPFNTLTDFNIIVDKIQQYCKDYNDDYRGFLFILNDMKDYMQENNINFPTQKAQFLLFYCYGKVEDQSEIEIFIEKFVNEFPKRTKDLVDVTRLESLEDLGIQTFPSFPSPRECIYRSRTESDVQPLS
jgi:hypothetical protein